MIATIKLQQEFARSEVVRDLTGQAEKQILTGENDQARASLTAALRLDPTYSVARERLAQIARPVGFAGGAISSFRFIAGLRSVRRGRSVRG